MARHTFQDCSLQEREDIKGGKHLYIRPRVWLRGKDGKPVRREQQIPIGILKDGPNARNPQALTRSQAERRRVEILSEINGQVYTLQSQIPWQEFCAIYKKNRLPRLKVPTQRTYLQYLKSYIEPAFTGRQLGSITVMDCDVFLNGLKLANQTKHSIKGALRAIFELAIKWGYLDESRRNPVSLVELPAPKPLREKVLLTPGELEMILSAVRPDVKLIIQTLVYTGMRISECLGLRWRNVNTERGYVMVVERQCRRNIDDPKSEKGRRPLPLGALVQEFVAHRGEAADDAFVFTDKDGHYYIDNNLLTGYLDPILKALGLKRTGFGWHAFRRFHGTHISRELSVFETSQQMGHADQKTTALYILPDMARREEAVLRMQGKLMTKVIAGAVN